MFNYWSPLVWEQDLLSSESSRFYLAWPTACVLTLAPRAWSCKRWFEIMQFCWASDERVTQKFFLQILFEHFKRIRGPSKDGKVFNFSPGTGNQEQQQQHDLMAQLYSIKFITNYWWIEPLSNTLIIVQHWLKLHVCL